MYLIRKNPLTRPWQGEIYKDVKVIQDVSSNETSTGELEWNIIEVNYNYIVILTQECDLEQDYKNRIEVRKDQDKFIPMILVAPAYLAESFKLGEHLKVYGQQMQYINSNEMNKIKNNENKRYHYI